MKFDRRACWHRIVCISVLDQDINFISSEVNKQFLIFTLQFTSKSPADSSMPGGARNKHTLKPNLMNLSHVSNPPKTGFNWAPA